MAHLNDGKGQTEYYYSLASPESGTSRDRVEWYNFRMTVLAVHDARPFIDDIPVRFMQTAKAGQYSTRLLMHYLIGEYRHRCSRMHNIYRNNGVTRAAAVGAMPSNRNALTRMYETIKNLYEELLRKCNDDDRCRWTLRRRNGSGVLMRTMEARFVGLSRELESRIGKPSFVEKWGTETGEAELALLRMQCRAAVAAPSAEAAKRCSSPVESNTSVTVRLCAEVIGEIVSTAITAASEAARRQRGEEHIHRVTEVLRERSARRPMPIVPEVVARPITGAAAVTQQSVDHNMRAAARIQRNEGLTLMRKPSQLEELNARLCLARMNKDQAAVSRIGACIARKKANNTRKNKRKYENKKRNKRMRREYDAALAAEMSDIDDDSDNDIDIMPPRGGGPPPSAGGAGVAV